MLIALALAMAGACALVALVLVAACRCAAIGDAQMAPDATPPAPVGDALAALPRDLRRFAEQAAATLDVDVAAILLDGRDGRSRVVAAAGAPGLEGAVLTGSERVAVVAGGDERGVAAVAELEGTPGALVVARRDARRPLAGRDLELLGVLADVADAAVRHPVTPELLDGIAAQVEVLSASLAQGRHDLRWRGGDFVSLVGAVGARLQLSGDERAELELAARLLDVGLLRIGADVLERPGPLRMTELFLVRRHAADGADVLLAVPGLAGASVLVRFHHERWDGRGYPHGLAGERIPLGARILAACDTWWAVTGPRPYAATAAPGDAAAELRGAAGSQLDPEVVDAMLGVLAHAAGALA